MKKLTLFICMVFFFGACDEPLEEKVYSELAPGNFYRNQGDAEALLNAAYANSQGYRDQMRDYLTFGEMTTDIMIERGGAINNFTQPVEDFAWDAAHPWLQNLWGRYFSAIYRCNNILDNVPDIPMNEDRKEQILAEARFLRAFNYFYLYDLFGPTPLITSSNISVDDRPEKATEVEFQTFVENEFRAVSDILPENQEVYPRATSGAALGYLCKFYLNNKKWQEAADVALEIIQSDTYALYTDGNRTDLFNLSNERNSEFMFVSPFIPDSDIGNTYLSHAAPPGFVFQYPPKVNFAAQFKIRSEFINSFDPDDERLDAFLFEYVNGGGNDVVLGEDDVRSLKYPEDPNGVGDVAGNDFPLLRYADILLSRAEALNRLNGPNQESIDLINQVRDAAGITSYSLTDFSGQEDLEQAILQERGWEFHTEGLRRQDLKRHDIFISMANDRGKTAASYQRLFPIPQREIEVNQNLQQNEGY